MTVKKFAKQVVADLRRAKPEWQVQVVLKPSDPQHGPLLAVTAPQVCLPVAFRLSDLSLHSVEDAVGHVMNTVAKMAGVVASVPTDVSASMDGFLPLVDTQRRYAEHHAAEGYTCGHLGDTGLVFWLRYECNADFAVDPMTNDFERWALHWTTACDAARQNLRTRTPFDWMQHSSNLFLARWHDGYHLARLLIPDILTDLPLHGVPVAFPLRHDALFITGSDDMSGLQEMHNILMGAAMAGGNNGGIVCPVPLILHEGGWKVMRPDPATAQFGVVRQMHDMAEFFEC